MTKHAEHIQVWDIWVRLFHWSLAISVAFLLISGETGWQFFEWHRTAGEIVLALVVFRVIWGCVGSSNARLRQLVHSPITALHHIADLFRRKTHSERGHNAAGSWAVIALLVSLATQALTGMFIADEDEFIEGAFYGNLSDSTTELAYRIHNMNAEFLQIVVIVHIVMVFVYLLYAGQNLIRPMLTGKMPWKGEQEPPAVHFQKAWLGAVMAIVSLAAIGYLVGWYG